VADITVTVVVTMITVVVATMTVVMTRRVANAVKMTINVMVAARSHSRSELI
jgi:BarA-like signal transduction histidine kinase